MLSISITNNRLYKYWLVFIVSMIVYYSFTLSDIYTNQILKPVSSVYAIVCCKILPLLGYSVEVQEYILTGTGFSMTIANGCDALMPIVFLSLMIFTCPYGSWKYKIKGISLGFLIIAGSNIIRLVSLFIIGHHSKFWFDFFHIQFWQAYFILLSLLYFISWLKNIKT